MVAVLNYPRYHKTKLHHTFDKTMVAVPIISDYKLALKSAIWRIMAL